MGETANEADGVFGALYGDVPGSGTFAGTSGLDHDVLFALEKLCDMHSGNAEFQSVEGPSRMIWPHALKWVSFMHPTAGRPHEPFPGLVDTSRAMVAITRIYRTLFEVSAGEVAQLREERLDVLHPLLELWLETPDYVPSWTRGPDETTATHNIILAVYAALHAFSQEGASEFFVSQLRQIMPTARGLDRKIVRLMRYITRLSVTPTSPRALAKYFGVLATVLTRYPRPRPFPHSVLRTIVDATHHCLEHENTKDVAGSATALLEALCQVHRNNHTLVRLIDVDIFQLILRIESRGVQSPRALAMRFAIALGQPSVLRVFHKKHGRVHYAPPGPSTQVEFIDSSLIVRYYRDHYSFYRQMRDAGFWKSIFRCTNPQGPHKATVCGICPCGDEVFCSYGCQRMRWHESHRHECSASEGPWRLGGAVTLNDVLHICTDVSCYIETTRQILENKIVSLLRQRRQPTQIVILADLTHLIPDYLYEPYARDHPGVEACARTVIVEAIILLGGASVRQRLPLSYDISYFLKA